MEKYGAARQATDDSIIWRMRFACRTIKARRETRSYLTLIPRNDNSRTRLNGTLYVHSPSCYKYVKPGLLLRVQQIASLSLVTACNTHRSNFLISSLVTKR